MPVDHAALERGDYVALLTVEEMPVRLFLWDVPAELELGGFSVEVAFLHNIQFCEGIEYPVDGSLIAGEGVGLFDVAENFLGRGESILIFFQDVEHGQPGIGHSEPLSFQDGLDGFDELHD